MTSKPPTLAQLRAGIRRDTETIKTATHRRDERVKLARAMGATAVELGADMGVTPGRISHIAPKVKTPPKGKTVTAELVPAGNDSPAAVPPLTDDELPDRFQPGRLARVKTLLSDVVTDRRAADMDERATIFVHVDSGHWRSPGGKCGTIVFQQHSAAELLSQLPDAVERVFLVGPRRPGTTAEAVRLAGSEADAVRGWFLADVPGWSAAGHWLADDAQPVGKWTRDNGWTVEVARASKWFGEGSYSADDAARAWGSLRNMIASEFPGGVLMSSPATTGRDLWRRTIGKERGGKAKVFPVLSDELRELIQSTSGQGRRELFPGAGAVVPTFAHYDMRFAYASMTWGMPVGEPVRVTGAMWAAMPDAVRDSTLKRRGRWLVRATVPGGWDHVGILPAPADGGVWTYPRTPGQVFTTWASASEVELARRYGWRVDVLEGMHWAEGKPLNVWRDKLVKLHSVCSPPDQWAMDAPITAGLCRIALRLMLLTAVGAFASRSHMISKSVPMSAGADALPAHAPIREVDGMYVWEEPGPVSEWSRRLAHPEWSAEIWARCRVRLLDGPTGTPGIRSGALHVPAGSVIGMRTDALYLAGDPGWPDDGESGRFRLKGQAHDVTWPATEADLSRLKTIADGGHS